MRVLITGGAGFIGANLTRELTGRSIGVSILDDLSTGRKENLTGLDADFHLGSILDIEQLTTLAAGVDAIVHLAARSSVPRSINDPLASHHANASGTLNVLEAARRVGGRHVIMASSSSVYGANPELPKRESAATRPMSPYAASKLAAEAYALAYGTAFGLPTLAFRFFNVFGRLQPAGHVYAAVIPAFVDAALRGDTITVHGDGTQSRDFTHVSTVCRTIASALENKISSPDPVNLAFGSRISLNEVLALIAERVDAPLVVTNTDNRTGDVPHSQADPTQLLSLFGDVTPKNFVDGLEETIDWMRSELSSTNTIDLNRAGATAGERAA
jgi:UDP-glucose 4-epimerase